MSTIEKLFAQIFERKKWIIEQLNHRKRLYDQHLASKLLIQGIPPPPWLLNSDLYSSTSSDLNGLNKEELISGLLLTHPQPLVPQSIGPFCLYNKSVTTAASTEVPDALFTGTSDVDKHESAFPPQLHVDGADFSIGHVAATPCDQTDARLTDIYANQSLARIQRSRSRQKALELRNSAKVSSKSHLSKENNPDFCSSDAACRIYGEKPNSISDMLELVKSSVVCIENPVMNEVELGDCVGEERTADVSTIGIMRSECQVVKEGETRCCRSKKKSNAYIEKIMKSGSLCQQSNVGDHQSSENSDCPYDDESRRSKTLEATQSEKEHGRRREKIENLNSGKFTISRNTHAQVVTGDHHNQITSSEGYNSRTTRSTSHESEQAETSDHKGGQKIDNGFTGTTTKSVSSCSQDEPMKPISGSNMAEEDGCALSKFTDRTSSLKPEMLGDGATDLQNHLDAQVTARDSEVRQNYAKVSPENVREVSRQSEVSEQHIDQITQPQSTHCSEDISKPVNSSNGLVQGVTRSKCIASCNPLLERSTNKVKHRTASTTQVAEVDALHYTHMDGAVASVRTELASSNLVEACPIDSGSNLQDGGLRVGLDVLVRSPLLNSGMFVKPKQLDFDDAEESCLYEVPDSIQKTGGHVKLEGSNVLGSSMYAGKSPSNGHRGKSNSVLGESLQELQDISGREGEASMFYIENKWGDLSIGNRVQLVKENFNSDPHAFSGSRTSEMFAPSLTNDEHIVAVDEVGHALPDCQRTSAFNSSCLPVAREDLWGRGETVDPCFSDLQKDGQVVLSTQKLVHQLDGGQNTVGEAAVPSLPKVEANLVLNLSLEKPSDHFEADRSAAASSEEIELGSSSCSDCKVATDPDITEVVQFTSCGKTKELAGAPALDPTPAISENETNCKSALQEIGVDTFVADNPEPYLDQFSIGTEVADCYKVMEAQPVQKSKLPEYSINSAVGGSWPLYKRRKIESSISGPRSASPSLRGEVNSETRRRIMIPSTFEHEQLKQSIVLSLTQKMTVESQNCCFAEGNMNRSSGVLDVGGQYNLSCIEDKAIAIVTQGQTSPQVTIVEKESLQRDGELDCSVACPQMEYMDIVGSDQSKPVFEGFIIDREQGNAEIAGDGTALDDIHLPESTIERASFVEQLCKSAALSTPLSHFSTAYKSQRAPTMYHSLPNGLLEQIDLKSTLPLLGSADQQVKAGCLSMEDDVSCSLQGKSYSDCLAIPVSQFGWDFRKPYLSPAGKGFDGIPSKSFGSDKQGSSNPELTCFPIEEDPESSDGNISANDIADTCEEENGSSVRNNSLRGEPLCNITVNHNSTLALYHATERGSLEFLAVKTSASEMHNMASQKTGKPCSRSRHTSQGKENQNFSLGPSSIKQHSEALNSRLNKPKLSGKPSLRSGGRSVLEKEHKQNNIVSNMKSFLPLVKQKQAAATAPGKRDVKVKALEAAEAAKRLAEKRENERKQKKEALKLERARVGQENLKLMELQKKLKEDERKKKDADIAVRKRQREEEERKEKERKRRRVGEARKKQRSQEEKVQEETKECRASASIEETRDSEGSNEEKQKHAAGEKEEKNSSQSLNESSIVAEVSQSGAGVASTNDHKASASFCGSGKVEGNVIVGSSTPNHEQTKNTNSMTDQEQSYEISPYQCSDDEEEEEDDIGNKKFIPTWASKGRVAQALSLLPKYDPDVIFPLGSFCSLDEVLLPRQLQQNLSAG